MKRLVSSLWKWVVLLVPMVGSAQWNTQAWAHAASFRNTNAVWATAHDFMVTNWPTPTNTIVTNETWLSHVSYTNWSTNAISASWTIKSLRWTNGVATNFSYVVSDTKPLVQTNLIQHWSDQIVLDCALAVNERMDAIPMSSGFTVTDWRKTRIYRERRQTLEWLKAALDYHLSGGASDFENTPRWVSESVFSNMVAGATVHATNVYSMMWHDYSSTPSNDIRVAASVPSNYFSATFNKDLFYTNSVYQNVMTCRVTFAAGLTNRVTNTVTDCCGNTGISVSGTNNEVVLLICTNANILPSKTAADYNFYGLRRIITNMTMLNYQVPLNVGGFNTAFGSSFTQYTRTAQHVTNPVSDAVSVTLSRMDGGGYGTTNDIAFYADYTYVDVGFANSLAKGRAGTNLFRFAQWGTPMPHYVEWWFSGRPVRGEDIGLGTLTTNYNDMGTGLTNQPSLARFQSLTVTGSVATGLTFYVASQVSSTGWVAGVVGGEAAGLGYNLPMWFSWPKPTTNGFRYR